MKKLSIIQLVTLIMATVMTIATTSCQKKTSSGSGMTTQSTSSTTGSVTFKQLNSQWACGSTSGGMTTYGNRYEHVGLANNSAEILNNIYFKQTPAAGFVFYYTFSDIEAGKYYYKSWNTVNTGACSPSFVSQTQSAPFTIIAGQNDTIQIP